MTSINSPARVSCFSCLHLCSHLLFVYPLVSHPLSFPPCIIPPSLLPYLPTYTLVYLLTYIPTCLPIHTYLYLPIHAYLYLPIHAYLYMPTYTYLPAQKKIPIFVFRTNACSLFSAVAPIFVRMFSPKSFQITKAMVMLGLRILCQ